MLLSVALTISCGKFSLYNSGKGDPIASVADKELYMEDLDNLFSKEMSKEDSVAVLESYINSWIRTELKTIAAEELFSEQQSDIEEMVKAYRTSLLTYKYEAAHVEKRLDTLVTAAQTVQYYNDNKENFLLSGPIVKARIVRLPIDTRKIKKMEEMFRSSKPDELADFVTICEKNGYRLDDFSGEWADFNTVLQHIPFSQKNFDDFLKSKSYYEVEDDQFRYMMKIESYRLTGEHSPAERETSNIRKILLNKRRTELIKQLDDSLYTVAQEQEIIKR